MPSQFSSLGKYEKKKKATGPKLIKNILILEYTVQPTFELKNKNQQFIFFCIKETSVSLLVIFKAT